jgi:hypothetical protein
MFGTPEIVEEFLRPLPEEIEEVRSVMCTLADKVHQLELAKPPASSTVAACCVQKPEAAITTRMTEVTLSLPADTQIPAQCQYN